MHGKVKRLRERGQRLSDLDIGRAPHVEGELTLVSLAGVFVLQVKDPNSQVGDSLFRGFTKRG